MPAEKLRILIIEDNLADIELYGRYLEEIPDWEIELAEFTHPQPALDYLKHESVDLILLDYLLGEMTGSDVFHQIRAIPYARPIIMLTAHGTEEIAVDMMKAGASDYLVKNQLSSQNLRRSIANAIEKDALKRKIEEQNKALLEAERTHVMMQSVAAACHHLSQPITAIYGSLELLHNKAYLDDEDRLLIETCLKAADKMTEILNRLREVQEYRTVPYAQDFKILDIGLETKPKSDKDEM